MRDPAFWWRPPGLSSALLAPIAAVYGGIAGRRMARSGLRAAVPVVCIGNLTLGGAGKTPTAIAVAKMFRLAGLKPVFLTRGFGGRAEGPLLVEAGAGADMVGDEPLLLAGAAPTVVSRDRVAGAEAAIAIGADVIVMDDGLQNPALEKTVSLVVLDGRRGIGNGRVFPAGPLRAPLAGQLEKVDGVLVIGARPEGTEATRALLDSVRRADKPVFFGALVPAPEAVAALRGKRLLAYAGIGDPEKFFATLRGQKLDVVRTKNFPDHNRFSPADAARLTDIAAAEGLVLVTTEKDVCRMQGDPALAGLATTSATLPVTLSLDEEAGADPGLDRWLGARTGLF